MTTTLIAPAPVAPGWAADVELFGEFETFKDRIKNVKEHGGYFTALCPAHDDTESSLSFTTGRTQAVVATCHAGCSYSDIRETVFPGWKRRHPGDAGRTSETVYTYRDENGGALFDVVRGPGKNFWQRHWDPDTEEWVWNVKDVRRVPYRLPELAKAVADSKLVFIVEGEKDADRLTQQGLVATTNPSGAGKWRDEYSRYFDGANVVILPDNDQAGRDHAEKVLESVSGAASSAAIVALPGLADRGDVSDWLNNEHSVGELHKLAGRALQESHGGLRVLSLSDLATIPAPSYLIDGFIRQGGLNLLVGPSGTGKTFAALDMGLSIATGIDWHGNGVEPGRVLYVAAEGANGMPSRADAWCQARQQRQPDGIGFVSDPLNLSNPRNVDQIIQAAAERDVDLIVIDPLARFMEGADENSSKDMGAALAAFGRIQRSTGATLLVIHHTGKDPSRGERGHSSLRAGADQVLMMRAVGALIELKVDKARDAAGGDSVRFSLEPVAESAVLRTAGSSHEQTGIRPDELRALGALAATEDGATSTNWGVVSSLEHSPFQRARRSLVERNYVSGGGARGEPYQVTPEGHEALVRAELSEP